MWVPANVTGVGVNQDGSAYLTTMWVMCSPNQPLLDTVGDPDFVCRKGVSFHDPAKKWTRYENCRPLSAVQQCAW